MSTPNPPPEQIPDSGEASAHAGRRTGTSLHLRGREHPAHGAVAVETPTAGVALATSAGGRPKPRPPVDGNEDCVAAVHGEHGDLLILADAHHGADAAELAVESVMPAIGPSPPARLSVDEIVTLMWDAGFAVQRGTSRLDSARASSATTLALALVTPDCVQWGSFGDSSVLIASGRAGRRLDHPRPAYLGFMFAAPEIAALVSTGLADRGSDDAVVLASDGYLDFGVRTGEEPGAAVARCVEGASRCRHHRPSARRQCARARCVRRGQCGRRLRG